MISVKELEMGRLSGEPNLITRILKSEGLFLAGSEMPSCWFWRWRNKPRTKEGRRTLEARKAKKQISL